MPDGTRDGPPQWVTISSGDSWGWYDHRLHPADLPAPQDQQRPAELASFEVPLRYGEQQVLAVGRVQFRPLLGALFVSAAPAPDGLQVQALPGRLPGLFLSRTGPEPVSVLGRDGEPFLRLTDAGVEVNENSRTHVEDRQARGQPAGPPSTEPAFRLVAPGASSYTWLDTRLRYPADLPPQEVLGADGPTVVKEWVVPVELDGRPATLTGDVTWVPEAVAAAMVGGTADEPAGDSSSWLVPVLGAGALLVLAVGVLAVRRAQRRTAPGVPPSRKATDRASGHN